MNFLLEYNNMPVGEFKPYSDELASICTHVKNDTYYKYVGIWETYKDKGLGDQFLDVLEMVETVRVNNLEGFMVALAYYMPDKYVIRKRISKVMVVFKEITIYSKRIINMWIIITNKGNLIDDI